MEDTIVPGMCVDKSTRDRKVIIGTAGISISAFLWLLFFFTGLGGYMRLLIFIPSWIGFLAIWQSRLSFCEEHALRHKTETVLTKISDYLGIEKQMTKGTRVHAYSWMLALIVTTIVFTAALFISPVPAPLMKDAYMRVLEGF